MNEAEFRDQWASFVDNAIESFTRKQSMPDLAEKLPRHGDYSRGLSPSALLDLTNHQTERPRSSRKSRSTAGRDRLRRLSLTRCAREREKQQSPARCVPEHPQHGQGRMRQRVQQQVSGQVTDLEQDDSFLAQLRAVMADGEAQGLVPGLLSDAPLIGDGKRNGEGCVAQEQREVVTSVGMSGGRGTVNNTKPHINADSTAPPHARPRAVACSEAAADTTLLDSGLGWVLAQSRADLDSGQNKTAVSGSGAKVGLHEETATIFEDADHGGHTHSAALVGAGTGEGENCAASSSVSLSSSGSITRIETSDVVPQSLQSSVASAQASQLTPTQYVATATGSNNDHGVETAGASAVFSAAGIAAADLDSATLSLSPILRCGSPSTPISATCQRAKVESQTAQSAVERFDDVVRASESRPVSACAMLMGMDTPQKRTKVDESCVKSINGGQGGSCVTDCVASPTESDADVDTGTGHGVPLSVADAPTEIASDCNVNSTIESVASVSPGPATTIEGVDAPVKPASAKSVASNQGVRVPLELRVDKVVADADDEATERYDSADDEAHRNDVHASGGAQSSMDDVDGISEAAARAEGALRWMRWRELMSCATSGACVVPAGVHAKSRQDADGSYDTFDASDSESNGDAEDITPCLRQVRGGIVQDSSGNGLRTLQDLVVSLLATEQQSNDGIGRNSCNRNTDGRGEHRWCQILGGISSAARAPTLIVSSAARLSQWRDAVRRRLPCAPCLTYSGARRPKHQGARAFAGYTVVLTTYSVLKQAEVLLSANEWWGEDDNESESESLSQGAEPEEGCWQRKRGLQPDSGTAEDERNRRILRRRRRGFGRGAARIAKGCEPGCTGVAGELVGTALHKVRWHRVIIDDAKQVGNPSTIQAGVTCALRAAQRWVASTQEPQQLKRGVLHFLRVPSHVPTAIAVQDLLFCSTGWEHDT